MALPIAKLENNLMFYYLVHLCDVYIFFQFCSEIENQIESVPLANPELLEAIIENISGKLHPNHYLITDTKRRLIDIYGVEKKFLYENLGKDKIGIIKR